MTTEIFTFGSKLKFIEKCFGKAYISTSQRNVEVRCPVCQPKDPTKKKLSIRIADDAFNCWVCSLKGRSLIFLLKKYGTQELINEYIDTFAPSLKNKHKNAIITIEPDKFTLPNDFKLLAVEQDTKDPDTRAVLSYLRSRDITERDLWYFKFGVSNQSRWFRRALVPSFDSEGNADFLVGRSIDSKRMPKYQQPHVQRGDIVFNELNVDWTKRLVLCQGVFDVIKCGDNAVPLLGSSLNEHSLLFERIVTNMTPVVIALDNDMVDSAIPRIVKKLDEYQIEATIVDLNGKKDPGEMTRDEFKRALENTRSLDWYNFFQSKLNRMTNVSLSK